MDLNRLNVVVVGGGIGGAAAALLFARAGARVILLEKVAEPRAVGAGIALAPNGLAVLEGLGLGPELERVGCRVATGRLADGRGRSLIEPKGQPRVVVLRRSELQELLYDALGRERGLERRLGAEVEATRPEGVVRVAGQEIHADLIVGADGVHSKVRESGGFRARVERTGISYVRGLVHREVARSEEAWTAAGLFGSFAVRNGTYFFASLGSAECRRALAERDLDGLREAWAEAYPPAAEILAGVGRFDDLLVNEVSRVRCERFVSGKIALLGDAAHAMPPNLGQGANSALVDAVVLVAELRAAAELGEGLERYDRRRRPKVERVATTAARLGHIAEWRHPLARWLRDRLLMPAAAALSGGSAELLLQEDPGALAH